MIDHPQDALVASLTGGNLLTGTATPAEGGGSAVVLEGGGTVRAAQAARGRVGAALYPWDVEVSVARPPEDGRNALAGAPALAETLARGEPAFAVFSPDSVRLVPLEPGAQGFREGADARG